MDSEINLFIRENSDKKEALAEDSCLQSPDAAFGGATLGFRLKLGWKGEWIFWALLNFGFKMII